jgi:hypothetical protein
VSGPDDDLRSAYGALPRDPGPCPSPEQLTALAIGEMLEPERSRLADHVVACARCAADWRILSETNCDLAPQPRRGIRWFALAAAAAVLVVVGLLVIRPSAPRPEAVRGKGAASESAVVPKAGSRLDAPPREFAWTPPAGASSHRLRLFDASGRRVWESEPLVEPKATLPEAVGAALPDGPYFWTVDVETAAGAEKLGPFPFDLARR